MVTQLGGKVFDEKTNKWDFNTTAGKKAIEMLDKFVELKTFDPTIGSALSAYPKGLVGMFHIGIWFIPYLWNDFPEVNSVYYTLPAAGSAANQKYLVPSSNLVCFSKRLTGDKKKAALLYAKSLLDGKFSEIAFKHDWGIPCNKVFVEKWKKGEYRGVYDETQTYLIERIIEQGDVVNTRLKPIPTVTNFNTWAEIMTPEFQRVFVENGSYDDFVRNITDGLNAAEEEARL
jgi:ABC-type glycerol-3-phosphate transport system substrate-binding protein